MEAASHSVSKTFSSINSQQHRSLQLYIMIMMNHSQQSQSLLYVAALASLLMIATRFQSCIALHLQSERPDDGATCADRDNYYGSTYATIDSGLKVMDALRAQTSFIRKTDIEVSNVMQSHRKQLISSKHSMKSPSEWAMALCQKCNC